VTAVRAHLDPLFAGADPIITVRLGDETRFHARATPARSFSTARTIGYLRREFQDTAAFAEYDGVMNEARTKTQQSIYPALRYDDAKSAIVWLKAALGFEEQVVYPGEGESIAHAQLQLAGNVIMLGSVKNEPYGTSPKNLGGTTGGVYIALETPAQVDAAYARAKSAGAEIVRELNDTDYGSHEFGVRDPEGYLWSFGTYRP
jgi:uncharacterized glyoxalase superfamily protein PhnB